MSDELKTNCFLLITHHSSLITFLSEEDFGDVVNLLVERLDSADGVVERDADHSAPAQGDHLAPLFFEDEFEGLDAEARGEHAVEGRGRAAALAVAEVCVAIVYAGLTLDLGREVEAYAAEPTAAVNLLLRRVVQEILVGVRVRVLRDDDDGEGAALPLAVAQQLADARDAEGVFRDEYHVGSAGDATVGCDPAGVAAPHLQYHDAAGRTGGRGE